MNDHHTPPLFAIALPAHGQLRRVWLFEAHRLNQEGSRHYSIRMRPSTRFRHWYDEHPGFLMEDADASEWFDRTTFILDRPGRNRGYMLAPPDEWDQVREVHMRWRFSGAVIYSMLCPDPIPILNMEHSEYLQVTMVNEMRIVPATRVIYRVWRRRWDPEFVAREIETAIEVRVALRRDVEHERLHTPVAAAVPVPKFVADALVTAAVAAEAICPITMEPITAASAAVTSCFHVFEANAIAIWLTTNHSCPTCKQTAILSA
jgi:hypothetical protein